MCAVALVALVALATLGGAAGCSDEPVGQGSSEIINGTPVSSPETSRFVQLYRHEPGFLRGPSSGVLLDGETILTCGHCLDNSLCPAMPATGNVGRFCRFRPSSHIVRRANGVPQLPFGSNAADRVAARVSVHPLCDKPIGGSTIVTTVAQAKAILAGGKKHDRAAELRAELLAAKLNLAAASGTGEPLANAFVYGGRSSVATAVASGDDVLTRACPGLVCAHELGCGKTGPHAQPPGQGGSDTASQQEIQVTTRLLAMINARKLEYRAP
jgi:hypothetical protein